MNKRSTIRQWVGVGLVSAALLLLAAGFLWDRGYENTESAAAALGQRVEELFERLIDDPMFETLLLFRSPRGFGLKWFVHIDLTRCDHRTWYTAIRNYLMHTYNLDDKQVDKTCGNPSRACYLCHDPLAYIKPDLIEFF